MTGMTTVPGGGREVARLLLPGAPTLSMQVKLRCLAGWRTDVGRAVTWQGDRGAGRCSPCSSLATAGMVAGTMSRGQLACDEGVARVFRLACVLRPVMMVVWPG